MPVDHKFGVKILAKFNLLNAINLAASMDPNAEQQLIDPDGQTRAKVNQLVTGFMREFNAGNDFMTRMLSNR